MGYHDEAPGNETPAELRRRLESFGLKVHELVQTETLQSGCAGVFLGYGLGMMMAQGATEEEVREAFEKILRPLVDQAWAVKAHERETFS